MKGIVLVILIFFLAIANRYNTSQTIKKYKRLEPMEVSEWEQDYSSGEEPKRVVTFFVPNSNFYALLVGAIAVVLFLIAINR